jgi:hypothetical protein
MCFIYDTRLDIQSNISIQIDDTAAIEMKSNDLSSSHEDQDLSETMPSNKSNNTARIRSYNEKERHTSMNRSTIDNVRATIG